MPLALLTNLQGQFGGGDEDKMTFSSEDFEESSEKVKQRIKILVDKGIPLTTEILRKIQITPPVHSASEHQRLMALQHTDDLVSMSDGQIWLDEKLYAKGQRPAMDAQRSITRVGVRADIPSWTDAPPCVALQVVFDSISPRLPVWKVRIQIPVLRRSLC
jgi:hypothetical protein